MELNTATARLLEPLYAAVSDDANWPGFLDELCRQCRGDVSVLFLHDYAHGDVPYFLGQGMDEALQRDYVCRLGAMNPWVAEQQHMPEGSVVLSHRLASDAFICRTEYFADFMRPLDLRHAVGSNIVKSEGRTVKMGVVRSRRRGPMGEREARLFTALMPALQSAVRLRGRLEALHARSRVDRQLLEGLATGVVLLDRRLAVCAMNAAAQAIVDEGDGLRVDAQGRLRAGAEPDQRWLDQATSAAATLDAPGRPRLRTLQRPSGRRGLTLEVEPVRHTPMALAERAVFAVFVTDPERRIDDLGARLVALLGLTPAEARLTARLAEGLSLGEAAVQLGISEGTARFVSKRVFAKTGTRGQADLLRLVLRSGASRR